MSCVDGAHSGNVPKTSLTWCLVSNWRRVLFETHQPSISLPWPSCGYLRGIPSVLLSSFVMMNVFVVRGGAFCSLFPLRFATVSTTLGFCRSYRGRCPWPTKIAWMFPVSRSVEMDLTGLLCWILGFHIIWALMRGSAWLKAILQYCIVVPWTAVLPSVEESAQHRLFDSLMTRCFRCVRFAQKIFISCAITGLPSTEIGGDS